MPSCAAAVRAVLEALGKKAGPEDDRTEGKRFHDALQLACAPVPRVCLIPRAGSGRVSRRFPLRRRCRSSRGGRWPACGR
jgi:hypothetical protein